MTGDRWTCEWCGYKHPVATMVDDHRERCDLRPVREVAV